MGRVALDSAAGVCQSLFLVLSIFHHFDHTCNDYFDYGYNLSLDYDDEFDVIAHLRFCHRRYRPFSHHHSHYYYVCHRRYRALITHLSFS